jgi:hypothetical protein
VQPPAASQWPGVVTDDVLVVLSVQLLVPHVADVPGYVHAAQLTPSHVRPQPAAPPLAQAGRVP